MSQASMSTVYVKHSDLPDIDIKHIPLILCESMNELTPDHVRGAQLINGIWSIWLRSDETKNYIIEGNFTISIGNNRVFIYGDYPIIVRRPPSEKVLFKNVPFHVHDDDLLHYIYSNPDMKVQTKCIIPARLRNRNRELTPYLSGDRFLYVRGDLRRVLPPIISINNHNACVIHQAQDLACNRCRYFGHNASDTKACDAFTNDANIITIRSPKNVLSNYYICDVHIYGHTFRSSEHAFQWKLCQHVNWDDLAEEILNSQNADQAKEIASRVPAHLRGTWHEEKCDIMEEILEAKINSCAEFRQSLINSLGKRLVEAIKSDIFWSSQVIHPPPKRISIQVRIAWVISLKG